MTQKLHKIVVYGHISNKWSNNTRWHEDKESIYIHPTNQMYPPIKIEYGAPYHDYLLDLLNEEFDERISRVMSDDLPVLTVDIYMETSKPPLIEPPLVTGVIKILHIEYYI